MGDRGGRDAASIAGLVRGHARRPDALLLATIVAPATGAVMQAPHDTAQMASLYVHIRIVLGMIVGLGLTHLLRHFAN
ncbi:hypothetical protein GCM10027400_31060 [Pseudoxanthomonas daejeonensis]